MSYYQLNNAGISAIESVLIDCHRYYDKLPLSKKGKVLCLESYCNMAEQSANNGDSVAVWEISANQDVSGFPQIYTLDIEQFFDIVESE